MKKFSLALTLFLLIFITKANCTQANLNKHTNYDIAVTNISVSPSNIGVNQDCIITVTINNSGTSTIWSGSGINDVSYSFPDFSITKTVSPQVDVDHRVSPGGSVYYKFYGDFLTRGTKKLSFTVNANNQIDESNIANNSNFTNITVHPPADLDIGIDSITLSNTAPTVGENLSITVTIKNNGQISLMDDKGFLTEEKATTPPIARDVIYSFSNFDLKSVSYGDYPSTDNPLNPGESIRYVYSGSFNSTGIKKLSFQANVNGRLAEVNTGNDTLSTTTTVYADNSARDAFSISGLSIKFASSSRAIISWTTDKSTTYKLYYRQGIFTYFFTMADEIDSSSKSNNQTVTIDNLVPGQSYTISLKAFYNTVTETVVKSFEMPANNNVVVTSGPTIKLDQNLRQAVIDWSTNLLTTGYVYYNSGSGADQKLGSDNFTVDHEVILNKLPVGEYAYYIAAKSGAGTSYQSSSASFTIGTAAVSSETANTTNASSNQTASTNANTSISTGASANTGTTSIKILNAGLYKNLKGKIVLKVESSGEAYYVNPSNHYMYYLGRPNDAFAVMRGQGVGITNADLAKIPVGLKYLSGTDTDGDGLPDALEDALGTDKLKKDVNGNGYSDYQDLVNGYNPVGAGKLNLNSSFAATLKGKILLEIQGKGEAWYVNPADGKRYFLGRPADAFNVMRNLGAGMSNANFNAL